jgi:hypothetical protein
MALITWMGAQEGWWIMPTAVMEILVFVLFITVVIYYNLNKLRARQPEAFTQFYLLSIALKMVGGLTLIFLIVWDEPAAAMGNITLFIVSYLILTFLEVFFLLSRPAK